MATKSMIALETNSGGFATIYCHWDGGLNHNGKILFEHYKDTKKILKLIGLGDLSSLKDTPEECDSYRARGENIEDRYYKTQEELLNAAERVGAEYVYLWESNRWYVKKISLWNELEYAIEEEE